MIRTKLLEDLENVILFWSNYAGRYLGGIKPNTVVGPVARDGGWGFNAGLRFQLSRDEAMIVQTNREGARYTGFEVVDPWMMIAGDAGRRQVSLSSSQADADEDGGFTYIISASDPGVANWIDTAGLSDGTALLRWEGSAPNVGDRLIRGFRIVPLSAVAGLKGVARVSPGERQAQLASRLEGYQNRVR
jgi:hypothetical protein